MKRHHKLQNQLGPFAAALLAAISLTPAHAKVSAEQAAQLGTTLTPIGAQAAGNGTDIPPYDGGLPKQETARNHNPFGDDEPLFTITAQNYQQYADTLTRGHIALFKTFPDYVMPVYPTRRSATFPEHIHAATKKNASTVELTNDGFSFCCTAHGFPFPIPQSGIEVLWNHIMRYNTKGYRGHLNSAVTTTGGSYVVARSYLEITYHYNDPATSYQTLNNQNMWMMTKTVAPANKVGLAFLLHVPVDRIAETTNAWLFNRGQGRTRRVGKVGYDNPLFDGLVTHDQMDMFNGPLDRYTVKLIGKKELYVPYNSYALYSPDNSYDDIITKGHINQSLTRYEKHRVWVIEANVRDGQTHIYKKRVFYVDEDSWLILGQDMYDEHDLFWRTAEAHPITLQHVPFTLNAVQVHYDLQSRRYVILNMTNEESRPIEYGWSKPKKYFSPRQLKKFAIR